MRQRTAGGRKRNAFARLSRRQRPAASPWTDGTFMSRIWLGGILASPSSTIFLTKEAARHHRLAVTNRFSLGGALGENPTVRPGAINDGQFRASAFSDSIVSDCVVRTARETKFYSPPPPRTGGSS